MVQNENSAFTNTKNKQLHFFILTFLLARP
jgi:hypothetical protein